jgi:peptidoglycan/xylan/chitin deacetylase (PgdA/CDA1 family)
MRQLAQRGLSRVDRAVNRGRLAIARERPTLLTFLFHGVFDDRAEIDEGLLDPQQSLCVADYRQIFEYYLAHGYHFVTADQIVAGLDPAGRHVCMTFDDGYHNNLRLLPLLEELQVPAQFFISTGHVKEQRCFWWDVVHRERRAAGVNASDVSAEQAHLKDRPDGEIRAYLQAEFGPDCEQPRGDGDRPLTPDEARQLAAHPWAGVGNHTVDHAILTAVSPAEVRTQIRGAQDDLEAMIGERPRTFAYPNGNYDPSMFAVLREEGIDLAISCDWRTNSLPLRGDAALRVGRFSYTGPGDLDAQGNRFRSDVSPYVRSKQLVTVGRRLRSRWSRPAEQGDTGA